MISIFADVDNTLIPETAFESFITEHLCTTINDVLKKPQLFDYVFIQLYNSVFIDDNILFVINDILRTMNVQCQFFLISKKYSSVSVQALYNLAERLSKNIRCYPMADIVRSYTIRCFIKKDDILIHDYDDNFDFDERRIIRVNNDNLIINKNVIPLEYDAKNYSMYRITNLQSKIELAKNLVKLIQIGE